MAASVTAPTRRSAPTPVAAPRRRGHDDTRHTTGSTAGKTPTRAQKAIQSHLRAALISAAGLVVAAVVWASVTELGGAVVGAGQLVAETMTKKIQHQTGGLVGEIRVEDGDRVRAGDVLLRLDPTQPRANLNIYTGQLDRLMAGLARDQAELSGAAQITFPPALTERSNDPEIGAILEGERNHMRSRRALREGKAAQLQQQVSQLQEQVAGYDQQLSSISAQLRLISAEEQGVQELWNKRLVPFNTLNVLQRTREILQGQLGQTVASIATTKAKISETELKILQLDQDDRTELAKERTDTEAQIAEIGQKKVAAENILKHVEVVAPQSGVVQSLTVHTPGEVIKPGEAVMVIVPDENLVIEGKVAAADIDQTKLGAPVAVRFAALDQRTTPELMGEVSLISADAAVDPRTGASYYTVRISLPKEELARLGDVALRAGMPIQLSIAAEPRPALEFLVKPLREALKRTFRER